MEGINRKATLETVDSNVGSQKSTLLTHSRQFYPYNLRGQRVCEEGTDDIFQVAFTPSSFRSITFSVLELGG